jgi:chromosome segregation ATPase
MSEAIILTPGIDCAHEWHPIELEDTTCGYVDGDWLICDKCRSMVKKAEKVDTFAEEVLRLRDALKLVHRDAEYREIAIADLRADVASKQARITELEDMIERFWGTDAVKRAERAEKALQEMETRADFFEAKVVDVEAERDVLAAKLERTTMERIKARNERDRYRMQRDGLKAAVLRMWNRVPVVEHDYAEMADKLELSDRALHKTIQSVLAVTGEWDKAKDEVSRLRAVLTVIAQPNKHYLRTGDWIAYMWNMQHAAQASLDGVPNDKNDPLAALKGEK